MNIDVATPYGKLTIVPIEADRLRIEAGIPLNVTDERLVINGVPHSAQGFMYLWSDSRWHFGREDDRMSQLHECRLKRGDFAFSDRDATASAQKKGEAAITEAVNAWAETDEAKVALADANVAWLSRAVLSANDKLSQAQGAAAVASEELEAANDALKAACAARHALSCRERLEELRVELRAERISQGELIELQGMAEYIEPGDVELLEAAGVPEFPEA